ncbi:MAG: hypothetical protein V3U52_01245 [Thermoplasmata archaeon]
MKVVGSPLPHLEYTPVKTAMGPIPKTIIKVIDDVLLRNKVSVLSRTYLVDGLFTEAKAEIDGKEFVIVERAYMWLKDSDKEGFPLPPDFSKIWMNPILKKRLPTADYYSLVFQIGRGKFRWLLMSKDVAEKIRREGKASPVDEGHWVYHLLLEEGEEIA